MHDPKHPIFYRDLVLMKNECVLDKGRLAFNYRVGTLALKPIIFSHGLKANHEIFSGLIRDLVSYGHIVFAINHEDESCVYTEDANGKPVYYNKTIGKEFREGQLEIREREVLGLIKDLEEMTPELHDKIFDW